MNASLLQVNEEKDVVVNSTTKLKEELAEKTKTIETLIEENAALSQITSNHEVIYVEEKMHEAEYKSSCETMTTEEVDKQLKETVIDSALEQIKQLILVKSEKSFNFITFSTTLTINPNGKEINT